MSSSRTTGMNYYAVEHGSLLEQALQAYDTKAAAFAGDAQRFAEYYGGQSVIYDSFWLDYSLCGFFFENPQNAHKDFCMDNFGRFHPTDKGIDLTLRASKLDKLSESLSQKLGDHMPNGMYRCLRYAKIGNLYIVAVPPNEPDGSVALFPDSRHLGKEELATLTGELNEKEQKDFDALNGARWTPPVFNESIFTPSERVLSILHTLEDIRWGNASRHLSVLGPTLLAIQFNDACTRVANTLERWKSVVLGRTTAGPQTPGAGPTG